MMHSDLARLRSVLETLSRPSSDGQGANALDAIPTILHEPLRAAGAWLAQVRQGGEGAFAELVHAVDHHALDERPREALLQAVMGTDAVGRLFEDWANVLDRDELLHGLRLLQYVEVLSEPMRAMVVFYFRASDPTLYQAAARTLGSHLKRDPEVYAFLAEYLEKRSIAIDAPIALNNVRSARRVLLALAACVASPHEVHPDLQGRPFPSMPLDLGGPSPLDTLRGSDLDLYLLAVTLLLSAEEVPRTLIEHAAVLAAEIARSEALDVTRLTLERWVGMLELVHQRRALSEEPAVLFGQRLDIQLEQVEGVEEVGPRVRQLFLLDTLLRKLLTGPAVAEQLLERLPKIASSQQQAFIHLRLHTWSRRLGVAISAPTPVFEEDESLLRLAAAAEPASGASEDSAFGGHGRHRHTRALLAELCGSLTTRAVWDALMQEERSMQAFLLLDYFRHGTVSRDALVAALEKAGVAIEQGTAFYTVLRRILQFEGESGEAFIDPHWLHQTDNLALLFSLLPSERTSPLLYVLADTLEHRLRQALVADARFDYGSLLAGIAARRPHPAFWHYLKRLAAERTYATADGRTVPVHAVIDVFLVEASAERPRTNGGVSDDVLAASSSTVLSAMYVLRQRLLEVREQGELLARLKALGILLHSGTGAVFDDLSSLVALRLADPTRPGAEEPHMERAHALIEMVIDRGPTLLPTRMEDTVAAMETARRTSALLEEVAEQFAAHLPYVERELLRGLCRDLAGELEAWTDTLDRIRLRWSGSLNRPPAQLQETYEAIVAEIVRLERPTLQKHAFQMLWTSMQARKPDERTLWQHRFSLLEWGATLFDEMDDAPSAALWGDLLAATWEELADEAMADGFESRLARLVRTPAFRPLRRRMPGDDLLVRLKWWLMDCYRLRDVAHVQQWLREVSGFAAVRELPRFYTSFFIHFSAVWTALLIGAILMLDFGDAWTTMAEVGDIQGIVLTFVLGTAGAFLYIFTDLQQKVSNAPEDRVWENRASRLVRASLFLVGCLLFTLVITAFLWFLLSGTDEVVHGANAILHVMVWTGFALFVGVFFGLLAKST